MSTLQVTCKRCQKLILFALLALLLCYEERASQWYHTNTSLIKSYHTVTHVIIFLSHTTTQGIIETESMPITPVYIIQITNFTNYRLLELSNATSNAQCSVWGAVAKKINKIIQKQTNIEKNIEKKYWTKILKKNIEQKYWKKILNKNIEKKYWTKILNKNIEQKYWTKI